MCGLSVETKNRKKATLIFVKAIFVQAKDEDAQRFYTRHGFIPSPGDPFHLFFPLDPLRQ